MRRAYPWAPLLVTPLTGIGIVWITRRWFPLAGGSGIPQTIAALEENREESAPSRFVTLKIAGSKLFLGVSALAAGFSVGREGPSVQVAASIMHAFRRFLPQDFSITPRHLILAGGAAGISAAFNTPLAGIIFAIEELGRRFEQKTNGILITAIVISGLVSISMQGNYTYFGQLQVGNIDKNILLPVLLCGLVCGISGGLFSRTLLQTISLTERTRLGRLRLYHPLYWAGFCGLLVALLGLASDGIAHGSGYLQAHEMLDGTLHLPWYYATVKFLATIFSYLSGIPGGIFAPALSIGAGIATNLMPLFQNGPSVIAIGALCMAGFMAAVTQAPLTSFIIVMEMINGHSMVISLMAVAMLASFVSRIFSPPIYSTLAKQHLEK
ncbi:MAG TPA: chloride channel protein [Rugosibacter sp.]